MKETNEQECCPPFDPKPWEDKFFDKNYVVVIGEVD